MPEGPEARGVAGAVLAGGLSRRMGRPKAWLPGPDGRPLVEVALAALRAAGAAPLVVGAGGDAGPFALLDARVVPDAAPGRGPLAGLQAVLSAAPHEWCLVVACDMPWLDPARLADLARRALASPRDAVVPRVGGRAEPLHAAYRRRCLRAIDEVLRSGRPALVDLLARLDVEWLDVPDDPTFANVNAPADVTWPGVTAPLPPPPGPGGGT